jgi:dTDP-4-dehydrorhamnose 3,5-epimerase
MNSLPPQSSTVESFGDNRGELYACWRKRNFSIDFVEDRFSRSDHGVLRGFHGDRATYKLCTCVYGEIFLVLWDVLNQKKYEYTLSDKNKLQVLVPPDFLNAHQCLSSECILFYKWSEYYAMPASQWSIRYDDPTINAKWPVRDMILSDRDKNAGFLPQANLLD